MISRPKLQVSNGYPLDLSQTARLLEWLDRTRPARWSEKAAAAALGVAERGAENIASLAAAMDLRRPGAGSLTPLGELLIHGDPYLADPLIPWIVHYNLGSNSRNLVWARMVNEVLPGRSGITREEAKEQFDDLKESHSAYSAGKHVGEELRAFFGAYTSGPLGPLGYLEQEGEDVFALPLYLTPPKKAFAYALLTYAVKLRPGMTALPIPDIASDPGSPGRVFRMREADVRAALEDLHRQGLIGLENRGLIDQARLKAPVDPLAPLRERWPGNPSGRLF